MDPFIAQVVIFAGNFAPRSWAFCDGQLLPISSNTALFSLIGTIYGGDGRTTMALPDLRGRTAIGPRRGAGLTSYQEGQKGGIEEVTLNTTQIPQHSHTIVGDVNVGIGAGAADNNKAKDAILATKADSNIYNSAGASGNSLGGVTHSLTAANTGGNLSHENRQPFLAINYIIALQGVFPSRS